MLILFPEHRMNLSRVTRRPASAAVAIAMIVAWLGENGVTLDEAARIQVAYVQSGPFDHLADDLDGKEPGRGLLGVDAVLGDDRR
jgi:hypothetical protein